MSDAIDLAPSCANCRYSVMINADHGTCNRYAPRPAQGEVWAEWPLVFPHDWCGEWAQALSDDELFAEFLARNAGAMPVLGGIPVPPTDDQPEPGAPQVTTYEDPFTDPLR
jgi:hypothetical protein